VVVRQSIRRSKRPRRRRRHEPSNPTWSPSLPNIRRSSPELPFQRDAQNALRRAGIRVASWYELDEPVDAVLEIRATGRELTQRYSYFSPLGPGTPIVTGAILRGSIELRGRRGRL
jgi:hypothetical protein